MSNITWMVQRYFDGYPKRSRVICRQDFCLESCTQYRPLSDSCEALENGMPEDCPKIYNLIDSERIEAMSEGPVGDYA